MNIDKVNAFKVDRTGWDAGEWDAEPDRVDFHHVGFACLALRNMKYGSWCGYVGVPSSHPDYQRNYNDVDVDCHGGLTYGDVCDNEHICHVPQPGEPDDLCWFGFDCNHCWDIAPGSIMLDKKYGFQRGTDPMSDYRSLSYVRHQIEKLAEQLLERASRPSPEPQEPPSNERP